MSLTNRFHSAMPSNSVHWIPVNPSAVHGRYLIYHEPMSKCSRIRLTSGIVIKSMVTLGIYYFICLRCTKDGKLDLENLKKKIFVHHVLNKDHRITQISQELVHSKASEDGMPPIHLVSSQEIKEHGQLLERNQKREEKRPPVEVIFLTNIFQDCMEKVQDFRHLCNDIKKIVNAKRNHFLDHLYEKNQNLASALEKFLNGSLQQRDSFTFIRLLAPFLKEKDLAAMIREAMHSAASAHLEHKTTYHLKFEEFRMAFNHLTSKADWLISISRDSDLLHFVAEMEAFGENYSPSFKNIYDKNSQLYNRCLLSMKEVSIDLEMKNSIVACFKKWKNVKDELYKNLALELKEKKNYDVYHSLGEHHLKDQLETIGFNADFQATVVSNEITANFISRYVFGQAEEILHKVELLLTDSKLKQAAIDECQKKVKQAEWESENMREKIEAAETKMAFIKMKRNFIEHPAFNKAVCIIVETEFLFRASHPKNMDQNFFNFFHTLKFSEFFINGVDAKRNQTFYLDFKDYFNSIDLIITQLTTIMKKK